MCGVAFVAAPTLLVLAAFTSANVVATGEVVPTSRVAASTCGAATIRTRTASTRSSRDRAREWRVCSPPKRPMPSRRTDSTAASGVVLAGRAPRGHPAPLEEAPLDLDRPGATEHRGHRVGDVSERALPLAGVAAAARDR